MPLCWISDRVFFPDCGATNSIVPAPARPPRTIPAIKPPALAISDSCAFLDLNMTIFSTDYSAFAARGLRWQKAVQALGATPNAPLMTDWSVRQVPVPAQVRGEDSRTERETVRALGRANRMPM